MDIPRWTDYKVSRIYGSFRRTSPQVTRRGRPGRPSLWLFEQIKRKLPWPLTPPHNAKITTNCTPAFVVGSDNDAKIGRSWFRRQAYSSTETLIHQQTWRRGALDSSAELEPDEFRRLRRKRFF